MDRILPFMWFASGACVSTLLFLENTNDKGVFAAFVIIPTIVATVFMECNRYD